MSRNNTGNPLGSKAYLDFEDNVRNLDDAVNTEDASWVNRRGWMRKSWTGMEREFGEAQAEREQRFSNFMASSGYRGTGPDGAIEDYAAGIRMTDYNQILRDEGGEFWRVSGATALPYTTTGAGLPESAVFVPVGDAALRQQLSTIGAPLVAFGGQTVQTRLDSLKGVEAVGSTSGESFVTGAGYNRISNINSASVLLGGQVTQPNAIGKAVHIGYFVGDGVQDTFVVDLPFVFELTPWTNLRANLIRDTGLFQQSYTIDGGVTVTGVGTNQISVKMPIVVQSGWELEITVYSNEDAGNATLQLVGGYDSVSAAIANVIWSHHSIAPAGAGHNTLMGGSYLRCWGSYNFMGGGTNNRIGGPGISPIGSFVTGRGNRVNGSAAAAWGENCKAHGDFSTAFGRESYSEAPYSVSFGRSPRTSCPGEFAIGCAAPADSQPGLRQNSKVLFSRDTSNATATFLQLANSSSTWPLRKKFAGVARVKVVALSDDGVAAAFEGTFLVTTDAAGTALINGLGTDVVIPRLSGPSEWVAHFRATAGNIGVRGTGEAGKNIRWTADVDMTSSTWV